MRGSLHRAFTVLLGVIVSLHLSGCETLDTSPQAEGTGIQIFGAIYAAAKYKELNAAEAERVRIEAQRVFDRNVTREVERQRAKTKRQRKPAPRPKPKPKPVPSPPKRPDRKTPSRSGGTPSTPKPKPVPKPEPAPAEPPVTPEEKQADAALEKKIRQTAVQTVKKKYGANIAVPVKNPDNKAVVAFASVVGERVTLATRTAYEVNISSTAIIAAANRNKPVELEGKKYALLEDTSVAIGRP